MSIGSEYMEDLYDKKVQEFLVKLESLEEPIEKEELLKEYREHFSGFGIYKSRT